MTSYRGLPPKHIQLVQEFRDALMVKIAEKDPSVSFEQDFQELETRLRSASEKRQERELEISGSKTRANNWANVFRGDEEARKLLVVYREALQILNADEIQDIAKQRRMFLLGIFHSKGCYGPVEHANLPKNDDDMLDQILSMKPSSGRVVRSSYND